MEKMYIVYLIKENEVVKYVGVTTNLVKRTWEHLHNKTVWKDGRNKSAIPADVDSTTVKIDRLADFHDKTQALELEDRLIVEYDTINNGWNKQRSGLVFKVNPIAYNKNNCKQWRKKNPEYEKLRSRERSKTEEWKEYHRKYISMWKRKQRMKNKEVAMIVK